jgi:hypothetical protein
MPELLDRHQILRPWLILSTSRAAEPSSFLPAQAEEMPDHRH